MRGAGLGSVVGGSNIRQLTLGFCLFIVEDEAVAAARDDVDFPPTLLLLLAPCPTMPFP